MVYTLSTAELGPICVAVPCNINGNFLPPNSSPRVEEDPPADEWAPFDNRVAFELAEFLYSRNQMPAQQIDTLMHLWNASALPHGAEAPFESAKDLYKTIDSSKLGDVEWESFKLKYEGVKPVDKVPSWMNKEYEVWYRNPHEIVRNILANTSFDGSINPTPYRAYNTSSERQYDNFMSGDWAWRQAVSNHWLSRHVNSSYH